MFPKDENFIPDLIKNIKRLTSKKIRVGYLDNPKLANIARINEYGARIKITAKMRTALHAMGLHVKDKTTHIIIPERSFLRSTFDDKESVDKALNHAENIFLTNANASIILNAIGLELSGEIKDKINSNIQPPNHPFTTKQKKGKDHTLINLGELKQGVNHEVI